MWRVVLTQMRAHRGRLVAAGVAALIASSFLTATLLFTGVMERSTYNAVLAGHPGADVVVTGNEISDETVAEIRDDPLVADATGRTLTAATLRAAGRSDFQMVAPLPDSPDLRMDLSAGDYPERRGEVIVAEPIADRLSLDLGSSVEVSVDKLAPGEETAPGGDTVVVTGMFADPGAAFDTSIPGVFADHADVVRWLPADTDLAYSTVVVAAAADVTHGELRDGLAWLEDTGATVRTADEYAAAVTAQFTDNQEVLAVVLAGFSAVALFTAGMVISNTFTVIVAQRTRELALLRCVGATRRQVSRSVLTEACALGMVASVAGVLTGIGAAWLTLLVLGQSESTRWLPDRPDVPVTAVVVPLVVGVGVTMAAAMPPARAATKVAPLEALRTAPAPARGGRISTSRRLLSGALITSGGAILVVAVLGGLNAAPEIGLALGLLGGAVSFLGVVLASVAIVPRVLGLLGRFSSGLGVPARMAVINSVRHPRRAASTASALLIGVTLVTMMSTAASSAKATLTGELDERYPVDVTVGDVPAAGSTAEVDSGLPAELRDALPRVDGVAAAVEAQGATGQIQMDNGDEVPVGVLGVPSDSAGEVVRAAEPRAALDRGAAVVQQDLAADLGLESGDELILTVNERMLRYEAAVVAFHAPAIVISQEDLLSVSPDAPVSQVWLGLDAGADAAVVVRDVQDAVSDTAGDAGVPVSGEGAERAEISGVVDTILAVVTGLLAVTIVIALIGVSNTLSLSVIERQRESATLRALGLTRRQLRMMLAVEGVLVAAVGALLGTVLGLLYGWAGTLTVLGGVWDVSLQVPWLRIAVMLAIAVVAGLVASVLPGRRAARQSPVTALATA